MWEHLSRITTALSRQISDWQMIQTSSSEISCKETSYISSSSSETLFSARFPIEACQKPPFHRIITKIVSLDLDDGSPCHPRNMANHNILLIRGRVRCMLFPSPFERFAITRVLKG
mmetsp:Transcript_22649/g.51370  ORF Transcript_22649/g.51370 Transcript_22649/m.51370 type:complete len:116 (+) Transcript_22649:111-458(+)